ncbi:MAG TPA: ureidoglycolate lyase [Acidimicrobiia bacterium]
MAETIVIDAEPFTPDAWTEFGWVPVPDDDPNDGVHTLEFRWEDAHLNFITHTPEEVERTDEGFVVNRLYHHDTHTQALMPMNCPSLIAVAPAIVDFSTPHHAHRIRAFVLEPLECVVLRRGTWHYGPFPLGSEPVQLLNIQGRRYEEDSAYVDLHDLAGTRVTVRFDARPPGGGADGESRGQEA